MLNHYFNLQTAILLFHAKLFALSAIYATQSLFWSQRSIRKYFIAAILDSLERYYAASILSKIMPVI